MVSEAERRCQLSSPRRDSVQSRGVAQKDASGHAKKKHAVRYDGPQRPDGHPQKRRRVEPGCDEGSSPREKGSGGLAVQGHSERRGYGRDQCVPMRIGDVSARDPDRLHCARKTATAAGPVSGPGQN